MEVKVRPGDSLWYYSLLFDIPLIFLEKSNPQMIPGQLTVGGSVQIPGYLCEQYEVQPGDSLWKVANWHQLPLDSLYLVNNTADLAILQLSQTLHLPQRVNSLIISDHDHYTYDKMMRDIQRLQHIYPFIASRSIGTSVLGKNLIELQIGTGTKNVHLNGSFHANEWITTSIILRFINEYLLSLTNKLPIRGIFTQPLFTDIILSVVPMVNPDGVNLVLDGPSAAGPYEQQVLTLNNQNSNFSNWKANIRGVDLNKQYPAAWEIEAQRKPNSPAPRDYPGPYPLSEPEAIAMADLAIFQSFKRVNAFHTQGEEIYYDFEGFEPPESEVIVREYERVSGYLPVGNLDSYAGYKDWFIKEFCKPGFTVELGEGINPLPIEQFPDMYEKSLGIMLANLYL